LQSGDKKPLSEMTREEKHKKYKELQQKAAADTAKKSYEHKINTDPVVHNNLLPQEHTSYANSNEEIKNVQKEIRKDYKNDYINKIKQKSFLSDSLLEELYYIQKNNPDEYNQIIYAIKPTHDHFVTKIESYNNEKNKEVSGFNNQKKQEPELDLISEITKQIINQNTQSSFSQTSKDSNSAENLKKLLAHIKHSDIDEYISTDEEYTDFNDEDDEVKIKKNESYGENNEITRSITPLVESCISQGVSKENTLNSIMQTPFFQSLPQEQQSQIRNKLDTFFENKTDQFKKNGNSFPSSTPRSVNVPKSTGKNSSYSPHLSTGNPFNQTSSGGGGSSDTSNKQNVAAIDERQKLLSQSILASKAHNNSVDRIKKQMRMKRLSQLKSKKKLSYGHLKKLYDKNPMKMKMILKHKLLNNLKKNVTKKFSKTGSS
jgi:hypothetical protein